MIGAPLLSLESLAISVRLPEGGQIQILNDIGFTLEVGETLGVVGESGSGKSLLALAILGLLPRAAKAEGQILFEGRNLLELDDDALCSVRGKRIGMIFQEPIGRAAPTRRDCHGDCPEARTVDRR
jgi:peptide/nickel transport system ATP-binding protein